MGARTKLSKSAIRAGREGDRPTRVGAVPHGDHGDEIHAILREMEAEERNERLAARVKELEGLLILSLSRYADVPVGERRPEPTAADLPPDLWERPAPDRSAFKPEHHGLLDDLIGGLAPHAGERRAEADARAQAAYGAALAEWRELGARREAALAGLRAEAEAHNLEMAARESALAAGEPAAVELHARLVLEASPYPHGFPRGVSTSFAADSGRLIATLRAPTREEIVPQAEAFRFVPQRDDVFAIRRGETAGARLYQSVLAQMALRSLREVFSADRARRIEKARVILFTETIDPATGKPVQPQVLSVRATRRAFEALDLARVDPVACVRRLKTVDAPAKYA